MGKPKSKVCQVQVRGPLSAIAEDFRVSLLEAGYTPLTAVNKLRSVGYLGASEGECRLARMQRIQPLGLEHSLRIALGPSEVVSQRRQSTGNQHHWQPFALGVRHTRQEQTERVIAPPRRVVENVGFVVTKQHTWPAQVRMTAFCVRASSDERSAGPVGAGGVTGGSSQS
jgi:hypothetical protein